MAAHLSYEFTAVEVNVALHGMHPTKAPGPQGMVPILFQKYWDVACPDITKVILSALNTCTFPAFNHTFITLISKKKCLKRVSDYKPIRMYNVFS